MVLLTSSQSFKPLHKFSWSIMGMETKRMKTQSYAWRQRTKFCSYFTPRQTSESIDFPYISYQSLKARYRPSQMEKKKEFLNIVFRNYFIHVLVSQHLPPPKLPKVNIHRFTESWNSIVPCRSFYLILQCQVTLNVKRNLSLCSVTCSSHPNFFCSAGVYFFMKNCKQFWRKCSADFENPLQTAVCCVSYIMHSWNDGGFPDGQFFNDFSAQIHLFWKFKPPTSKAARCNKHNAL